MTTLELLAVLAGVIYLAICRANRKTAGRFSRDGFITTKGRMA